MLTHDKNKTLKKTAQFLGNFVFRFCHHWTPRESSAWWISTSLLLFVGKTCACVLSLFKESLGVFCCIACAWEVSCISFQQACLPFEPFGFSFRVDLSGLTALAAAERNPHCLGKVQRGAKFPMYLGALQLPGIPAWWAGQQAFPPLAPWSCPCPWTFACWASWPPASADSARPGRATVTPRQLAMTGAWPWAASSCHWHTLAAELFHQVSLSLVF